MSCFGKKEDTRTRPAVRRRRREANEGEFEDSEYTDTDSEEENPITLTEKDYDIFLPVITPKNKKIKLFDQACSICIDEINNGTIVRQIITCKHAFHSTCLLDWIKINESCPNCKEDLNKDKLIEKIKKQNPKKAEEIIKRSIDLSVPNNQGEIELRPAQPERRRGRNQQNIRMSQNMRNVRPQAPPIPQRVRRRAQEPENNNVDLDDSNAQLNPRDITDSQMMYQMQMEELEMWERQGGNGDMIPVQMV